MFSGGNRGEEEEAGRKIRKSGSPSVILQRKAESENSHRRAEETNESGEIQIKHIIIVIQRLAQSVQIHFDRIYFF